MTATYVGSLTLAQAMPAVQQIITSLNAAIVNIQAAVQAQASAVLTAKASIRLAALVDIQAQLNAALNVTASLQANIQNPALYISGLLAGIAQVSVNINALVPTVALSAQLGASLSIAATLQAKITAFDLLLQALVNINAALLAAISITIPTIDLSAGVYVYSETGSINTLGSQLTTALAGGLPDGTLATQPANALTIITTSTAAWNSMGLVLKTALWRQISAATYPATSTATSTR